MIRHDPPHQPASLRPVRRLLVLVPCVETDFSAIINRVWELAYATGAHIIFLCLCSDGLNESSLRARAGSMPAVVDCGNVSAEVEVISARDWLGVLKLLWREGDMLVCFNEHHADLLQQPLGRVLRSGLVIPLYVLSGPYPESKTGSSWRNRVVMWIGFIAIILGLFILHINIEQCAKHWTIGLELLSTLAAFGLIWFWNKLFE